MSENRKRMHANDARNRKDPEAKPKNTEKQDTQKQNSNNLNKISVFQLLTYWKKVDRNAYEQIIPGQPLFEKEKRKNTGESEGSKKVEKTEEVNATASNEVGEMSNLMKQIQERVDSRIENMQDFSKVHTSFGRKLGDKIINGRKHDIKSARQAEREADSLKVQPPENCNEHKCRNGCHGRLIIKRILTTSDEPAEETKENKCCTKHSNCGRK